MSKRVKYTILFTLILLKAFFILACGCSNAELRSNGDGTYSCPVGIILFVNN